LRRKTSIHDQIRLSDHGEILVSFFVLPFFCLPKPAQIRYKIAALASDVSLRRATLYPAELWVRDAGQEGRLAKAGALCQYQITVPPAYFAGFSIG
jgi:hypothetical protein